MQTQDGDLRRPNKNQKIYERGSKTGAVAVIEQEYDAVLLERTNFK